ncbi:integrin beta-PS-like [Centruroides sculpturatus]|uniref:integrin beta-PS-like n=1 Tax=Centruroides sculpturatus TaxID=218467 RepID=UPI000C6DED8D|nr:integrin beta-PS-like [Centruroides sculpturatus]
MRYLPSDEKELRKTNDCVLRMRNGRSGNSTLNTKDTVLGIGIGKYTPGPNREINGQNFLQKLCSGNGECVCGACKSFKEEEGHYSSQLCKECPECVQCKFFNSGPLTEEECLEGKRRSDARDFPPAPRSPPLVFAAKERDKLCASRHDDDCKFFFTHNIDSDGYVKIHVQRTKDCPEPVNILAIVLGVIGGIVAVGLVLLLIWKLLTTIHDRREFAKFEKERQMAKWDTGENSIYKQVTSTFENLTYGASSLPQPLDV